MRSAVFAFLVITAAAACYGLARYGMRSPSGQSAGRQPLYYVDPMHPSYKSDKPGTAPDCGMPLTAVYAGGPADESPRPLPAGSVTIDGPTRRLLGIRVVRAGQNGGTRMIHAVGRVAPEDTRIYRVNSGVDGVIRDTHDDSVGVLVKKDQKLATYYAPDFLAASSGFLAASERVPGAAGHDGSRTMPFPGALSRQGQSSLQGYTDRLRNLGMSDLQIQRMADARQLPETIDIIAPADGVILARNISPGQHFEHNLEFYRIADLTRVWVVAEVSAGDAPHLRAGDRARIMPPDHTRRYDAHVTGSLPESEAGGSTVKLRLEADNPELLLRPEMLVDVELPAILPSGITVPADALVDSGQSARVYVETSEGVYQPREVETGWRSDDQVEIRKGLRPNERVVSGATFLVDSESRLDAGAPEPDASGAGNDRTEAALRAPAKSAKDPNCGMPVDPVGASAAGNILMERGTTYYFCSKQCKEAFSRKPAMNSRRGAGDD